MKKILIITGTTASGKTTLALKKAEELGGEIINCDSRQIYKYLDIVTGKDIDLANYHLVNQVDNHMIGYHTISHDIRVWLYDIVEPDVPFSSYDYQTCALWAIEDILKRNKTPILCGGAYFYLQHLLYVASTKKIRPDWDLRNKLGGWPVSDLQSLLKEKSVTLYNSLNNSDRNNPQRLIRKIEIASDSPHDMHTLDYKKNALQEKLGIDLDIEIIGIQPKSAEALIENISDRVQARLRDGGIKETEYCLKKFGTDAPGLKTIGYSQLIRYLQNSISLPDATQEWIVRERQYAKRQITFMKKNPNIQWIV